MNNGIKIALIASAALIVAVLLYIYFTPYQTCVRTIRAHAEAGTPMAEAGYAELRCAELSK